MPVSSDIIALLANQGNAQAAGALRQGDIAAQEAARKQALWASIIGTGINVATNLPGQIAQMRDQKALADERNAKVQAAQRAQALDDRANGILNTLMTPEGRVDRNKLRSAFTQGKVPIDVQEKYFGSLDKVDAANDKYEAARTDAQADIANEILTGIDAGGDPDAMIALGLAHAKAKPGLMTPDEQKQIGQQLSESDNPKAVLMGIRARSEKYKKETQPIILPRPGAKAINPATGATIAESPLAPPKISNEAELALTATAANPAAPTPAEASQALEKIKGLKNPPSLEEQLLTAITNGDNATAARIRTTLKIKADASKDPAQIAMANELAGLRKQEAQARLDKLREENAPIDVANNTFTTSSGRKYVDLSEFQTPAAREKARKSADDAGLMVVNKEGAQSLQAADTARANLSALYAQIEPYLPKDASGRLIGGPRNKLEKIFQTNPTLGAFGSWRTAAIQAVQALAERGMGLRLNKAEIDLMLQNDIPQITDDAPTAKQRIDNVFKLLDNKEKTLLERDRSSGAGTGDADLVKRLNERRKSGG